MSNFINLGSFLSGFMPGNSGFGSTTSKPKSLLVNKSPVEAIDPEEQITNDPLKFNFVQYPIDLGNYETGHYIIFNILRNQFSSPTEFDYVASQKVGIKTDGAYGAPTYKDYSNLKDRDGNNIPTTSSENSVLSEFKKSSQTLAGVAIYMPPGVKVSYGMDYVGLEQNLFGNIAKGGGQAVELARQGKFSDMVQTSLDTLQAGAVPYATQLVGELSQTLGAGDPIKLFTKAVGIAINPHEEQFFQKPNFRSFSYSFDFYPRSKEEVKKVQDIIYLFKYHAHPSFNSENKIGTYFNVPSEFEIQYAYFDKQNEHLNKISRCVLTKVDITYGPENQFSTFEPDEKGASPVQYSLDLSFTEQQYLTKKQIDEGY